MKSEYLTLVINIGNANHYCSCGDEENNAEYLNGIGFPWEEAIEIAAWATFATEGSEYEQDTLRNVHIYII